MNFSLKTHRKLALVVSHDNPTLRGISRLLSAKTVSTLVTEVKGRSIILETTMGRKVLIPFDRSDHSMKAFDCKYALILITIFS